MTVLVSAFSTLARDWKGKAARLFSAENSDAAVAGEVAGEAADMPQSAVQGRGLCVRPRHALHSVGVAGASVAVLLSA